MTPDDIATLEALAAAATVAELRDLIIEANDRLHTYRQCCHCYSQMQMCPRCQKTLAIERRLSESAVVRTATEPKP